MRRAVVLILGCLLAACAVNEPAGPQTPVPRMPFPEEEYAALPTSGSGLLQGRVLREGKGEKAVPVVGGEVLLNPVTSYSVQWYEESYRKERPMARADQRLWRYVRKQVTGADGSFAFQGVPAGVYFVSTQIRRETGRNEDGSPRLEPKVVARRIHVAEGASLRVDLAP